MLFAPVITAFYNFYIFLDNDEILCLRGGIFVKN